MKKYVLTDLDENQMKELHSALDERLKSHDKAFKVCVKEGLGAAMEKVNDKILIAREIREEIKRLMK